MVLCPFLRFFSFLLHHFSHQPGSCTSGDTVYLYFSIFNIFNISSTDAAACTLAEQTLFSRISIISAIAGPRQRDPTSHRRRRSSSR